MECERVKDRVLAKLEFDMLSADIQWSLFISALESYRHDSVLRPFPSAFLNGDGSKDVQELLQVSSVIPGFGHLLKGEQVISQEAWELLDWALDKTFTLKTVDKSKFSELQQKTGQASYNSSLPDFIFEVEYKDSIAHNSTFNELSQTHDVWYAYHGSRVDNFHSILHNGLHSHLNKTSFFGEGTYLSSDLTVCMMYSNFGQGWKHSMIGDKLSCVAVCEVLDHPDVKCTVKSSSCSERQHRSRVKARNSEGGDVPERYYVVTNNQVVRVKYVLVYAEKKNAARAQVQNWLFFRYPLATIIVAYILFLFFAGISRSHLFQKMYRRYFDYS